MMIRDYASRFRTMTTTGPTTRPKLEPRCRSYRTGLLETSRTYLSRWRHLL